MQNLIGYALAMFRFLVKVRTLDGSPITLWLLAARPVEWPMVEAGSSWPLRMAFPIEWAPPALSDGGALTFKAEVLAPERPEDLTTGQPSRSQTDRDDMDDIPAALQFPWGALRSLPRWSGILEELQLDVLPEMPLAPPESDNGSDSEMDIEQFEQQMEQERDTLVSFPGSSGSSCQGDIQSNENSKPFEARFELLENEPGTPCSTRSTSGSFAWQPEFDLPLALKRTQTAESLGSGFLTPPGSLIVEKPPSVAPGRRRVKPTKVPNHRDFATRADVDSVCRRAEHLLKSMTAVVKSNERLARQRRYPSCPSGSFGRRTDQPKLRRAATST